MTSEPPPLPNRSASTPNKGCAKSCLLLVGVFGIIAMVITTIALMIGNGRKDESDLDSSLGEFLEQKALMRQQINSAHALWESDDRFEAVRSYKALLRDDDFRWDLSDFKPEMATTYRRVIEHEANYGDPGSARDWAMRAHEQGKWSDDAFLRRLTFDSEAAKQVWADIAQASRYEQ